MATDRRCQPERGLAGNESSSASSAPNRRRLDREYLLIGACVFNNDFRHPTVLAKEAATLDMFSGGRLELGLGAGWRKSEYEQVGIPFDAPGIRVNRLEESVRLIKALFADDPVTFTGTYYQVKEYRAFPKPVQRPHPPIILAGGGKRMLMLAAREANIIGVNLLTRADGTSLDMQNGTPEATAQKIAWIREAAGTRFDEIELSVLVLQVIRTDEPLQQAPLKATGIGARIIGDQPLQGIYVLAGTTEQICEQLITNREHFGISYIVVFDTTMEAFAPVVARLAGK